MNDDWEQFPPIEGNSSGIGAVVAFLSVVAVITFIVFCIIYILT